MSQLVDARGLSCPVPVIRTKQALDSWDAHQIMVLLDEEVARENVIRLAHSYGCAVSIVEEDGEFKLTISRTGEA